MANADVHLYVSANDLGEEWDETTSVIGTDYWYKFTGGNQGKGNQKFDANKVAKKFDVNFQGSDGNDYRFKDSLEKLNDSEEQLSATLSGNTLTVTDACTHATRGMIYAVWVYPEKNDEDLFLCHPRVSNQ